MGEKIDGAAPPAQGHPPGFFFIFFGEMAERFSYYGMRAILPLYLTTVLQFPDGEASSIYSLFKGACYLLPLLGGFLADRYFGKYWTIVGFSVPYVIGQFVLGINNQVTLMLALALLACGSGVIKPNISTLMGMTYDQKRPGQEALRTSAFLWFYFAINIGATISLAGLPAIRDYVIDKYGDLPFAYRVAFQFPAWLMVVALAVFALGKRHYAVEVIDRDHRPSDEERRQRWATLTTLFGIFFLMVFFWVAYEQNDNLWIFFARDHVRSVTTGSDQVRCLLDLGFTEIELAPDQFQWINGLLVLTFAPLFGWLFRAVDPHARVFKATTKILIGFLFTAGASAVMALAATAAADGAKVTAWWIVGAYVVLTVGEVLLYGTGLELAFTAAPANMKSFITACFLMTNFVANLINSRILPFYQSSKSSPDTFHLAPATFFGLTAGMVLVTAVAFVFVGRRFNRATGATT
jgi:POT family proton-dependent oligopeptide transporter